MRIDEKVGDILFLDIETVSEKKEFSDLSIEKQALWKKKSNQISKNTEMLPWETYREKAGIYAEFGKVVVIALGYLVSDTKGNKYLRVKALFNKDEKVLLENFVDLLGKFEDRIQTLCAHNGKEFDFPYLCRRLLINGIPLPSLLDVSGKKPWEVNHLDTMELWKFGDRKSYTSLELLTQIFGIPSSKDDIDGSRVSSVYYKDNHLERIAHYCRKDVLATVQVFLRMKGLP
ncbi:MAG: 3'-5' exonuclease, partial [Cyclobacteriaceae bacterium]|nr:3'-5' exonuclease [Cyclobacteriaceae bacterium]